MNYTRMPVRFVPQNSELLAKSAGADKPTTDYSEDPSLAIFTEYGPVETRYPVGRVDGNPLFRRYTDGSLDVMYAVHKVVDAIHAIRDSGGADVLGPVDRMALSVLFPYSFAYVDSGMLSHVATVQLRLSPMEVEMIRARVASHLAEEMNWNAGRGGGSVPGRSTTRF